MANTFESEHLKRAYGLRGADDAKQLYEEWASSYESELDSGGYISPKLAADAVAEHSSSDGSNEIKVLDAGCGTGLVADFLVKSSIGGRCVIDGLDLTQGMLDVAQKKGTYRALEIADLTKRIDRSDGSYDVVTCVGTLTKGHLGPEVFDEFVRVTAKGGIIVASVHEEIWEPMKFASTVEELQSKGVVDIVSTDKIELFKGRDEPGRLVILRKK